MAQLDRTEILQEEFLQERAVTLGKAGERLELAIDALLVLDAEIDCKIAHISQLSVDKLAQAQVEINALIEARNQAYEYALLRRYYLIVTREALGLRCHTKVDEFFCIGQRRRPLERID
ncbi:MAG: hypothetical protein K9K75_01755 [Deltaproteobacteria bacterium]|nr:hypothetical protein [Deltaproteobacteria bacterium]